MLFLLLLWLAMFVLVSFQLWSVAPVGIGEKPTRRGLLVSRIFSSARDYIRAVEVYQIRQQWFSLLEVVTRVALVVALAIVVAV